MKSNLLFTIAFSLLSLIGFSQTNFKKGQFVTNSGEIIECFIKDLDWNSNPTEFQYRFNDSDDTKKKTIDEVKVFEIYQVSKYIRKTVNIDKSGVVLSKLSVSRNPVFEEETLFLKVLIDGSATLYKFVDGNALRFFYSVDDDMVEQLVYKEYRTPDDKIHTNVQYQQQLINSLKCESISSKKIMRVAYNKGDLSDLFEEYNVCKEDKTDSNVSYLKKEKRDIFNLRLKAGIASASLETSNDVNFGTEPQFGNETVFRFGAELEAMLPTNNDKWAFVIEPSFQSYSSSTTVADVFGIEGEGGEAIVDYSTFELPLGIRHYLFLNEDSKIFVNAFFSLLFTGDSNLELVESGMDLELDRSSSFSLGAGYNYKNFGIEFRYELPRQVFANRFTSRDSNYNQISLIVGYQLF